MAPMACVLPSLPRRLAACLMSTLCLALAACAAPLPSGGASTAADQAAPPDAGNASAAAQKTARDAAEAGLRRLRGAIGDGACSSDAQCRTVALGAQACGGPQAYLAWSLAAGNSAQVAELAARYRDQQIAVNAASGQRSTCRALRDRGAYCAVPAGAAAGAGRCVLRPDSAAGDPR